MTVITYGNLPDTNFIVVDTIESRAIELREINKIYTINTPQKHITGCGTGIALQTIHQYFVADRQKDFLKNVDRDEAIIYLNNFLLNDYPYPYYPMRTDLVICAKDDVWEWSIDFDKASKSFINLRFDRLKDGEIKLNCFGAVTSLTNYGYNVFNIEDKMWTIISSQLQNHFSGFIPLNNYSYSKFNKIDGSFYCKFYVEPPLAGSTLY